jgi:hypothetical protein
MHWVFLLENKQRINELAGDLSGGAPGSPEFMAHYQAAVKSIKKEMTDEEQATYQHKARLYNSGQVPASVQEE